MLHSQGLLRLRADSHEERAMKHAVNSDQDVSVPISYPRDLPIVGFNFSHLHYELRKLTNGKRFIALSNSYILFHVVITSLASENPCQNLQHVTRRFRLHYYELNVTCVCSSSILDATVKGAVPRGPRLLTSVDTATSLGTSGPKRKNSGQALTRD
jgi:hypothetical protein